MASTTIDTETELSAVNSILGAIGQSPVTSLVFDNPEVSFIYNLLRDSNVDIQNEGWHFNTERHVTYTPDANKQIVIGDDIIRIDVSEPWSKKTTNVVRRNGKLYNKMTHKDNDWEGEVLLDVVRLYPFADLPLPFKRYITYRA